jgi:hypothetical protein
MLALSAAERKPGSVKPQLILQAHNCQKVAGINVEGFARLTAIFTQDKLMGPQFSLNLAEVTFSNLD